MVVRYYSSVAPPTTLSAGITAGSASIQVGSTSGFPALTPYTLSLSYDTIGEELVQVNAVGGTTLTVDRGVDGTSATSHNAGVEVRHVSSARDFADSRTHENSDAGIHGLDPGDVLVGEDKAQTLANKTLDMAEGTLNRIDIFNGPGWITTVNGVTAAPGILFQIKPDPSEDAVFDFGSTGISRWRNVVAHDTSNQYKFRITKSDGTTDVTYLTSLGQIRSVMGNGVDAWSVQGSPDNVRRRAFTTIDLNGSTVRNALYTDGTAFFASKSPAQITAEIRGASGQSTSILRVTNNVGTQFFDVDGAGGVNVANGLNVAGNTNVTTVNGRAYPRIASGTTTFNFAGVSQSNVTVTLPVGLFSSIPAVTMTLRGLPGTSSALIVRTNDVTTVDFKARCNDVGGVNRTLTINADWIAVQT